jgi:hypothetical protein
VPPSSFCGNRPTIMRPAVAELLLGSRPCYTTIPDVTVACGLFDGLAHERWRHGVQPVGVVAPGRSGRSRVIFRPGKANNLQGSPWAVHHPTTCHGSLGWWPCASRVTAIHTFAPRFAVCFRPPKRPHAGPWGAEIRSRCSPVLMQETAEPVVPTDFTSLCIADGIRAIG